MKSKRMCLLMMIGLLLVIDVPAYSRGWVAFRDLPYMWMNGLVRAIGAVVLFVFCTYAIQLTQNRYMKWARNCIAVLLVYYIVYTILCFMLEVIQIPLFVEIYTPVVQNAGGGVFVPHLELRALLMDLAVIVGIGMDILQLVMVCFLLSAGIEWGRQPHQFQVLRRCYLIGWILIYAGLYFIGMYGGSLSEGVSVCFLLPHVLNLCTGISAVRLFCFETVRS